MRRNHYCFCYRTPLLLVVATSSRFQAFTVPPPSSSPSSLTSSTAPCCTQQHTSRRKFTASGTSLLYTTSSGNSSSDRINRSVYSSSGQSSAKPHWIPMELVELASEDLQLTQDEFIQSFVDVEAYTSCDDEGDDSMNVTSSNNIWDRRNGCI